MVCPYMWYMCVRMKGGGVHFPDILPAWILIDCFSSAPWHPVGMRCLETPALATDDSTQCQLLQPPLSSAWQRAVPCPRCLHPQPTRTYWDNVIAVSHGQPSSVCLPESNEACLRCIHLQNSEKQRRSQRSENVGPMMCRSLCRYWQTNALCLWNRCGWI